MNIHPLFVHFPVALLSVYALLELLPVGRFFPGFVWSQIKHFFLYAGTLAIFPTIATGLMAAQLAGQNVILPYHKAAALSVLVIFCTASALALWNHFRPFKNPGALNMAQKILALLGLTALFFVGALGAAMVYGYTTDPIVGFVTGILGFH